VGADAGVRDFRLVSANIDAFATLIGFELPSDFVKMSRMPAASTTARTGPPAITPVPGAAGFIKTFAALKSAVIAWGIVESRLGTSTRLRRAFRRLSD
jgi:hypothetical protein